SQARRRPGAGDRLLCGAVAGRGGAGGVGGGFHPRREPRRDARAAKVRDRSVVLSGRRRHRRGGVVLERLLLFLILSWAGCPAAHTDYPGKSCRVQADCYEGEACVLNGETGTCTSGDGGSP